MTPEREAALRRKYPNDALERLSRAGYDYYSTHGDYLPQLADLLLLERSELDRLRADLADAETVSALKESRAQGWQERAEKAEADLAAAQERIELAWRHHLDMADDADDDGSHVGIASFHRNVARGLGEALVALRAAAGGGETA